MKKKLYIDLSEITFRDPNTGIQRVIKNILLNWMGDFYAEYEIIPIAAGKNKIFNNVNHLLSTIINNKNRDEVIDKSEACILNTAKKGDIYFMLDFQPRLVPALKNRYIELKARGIVLIFLIYDIIPITHPHFFNKGFAEVMPSWLQTILEVSDKIISISKSTQNEILKYIEQNKNISVPDDLIFKWFHIGADFYTNKISFQQQKLINKKNEKGTIHFLVVGTIEPRKGHNEIIQVFKKLKEDNCSLELTFVGKRGWGCDELFLVIENLQREYSDFKWLENADDGKLIEYYHLADYVICASLAEGFGLPLIEAANYGCELICRDIEVFREAAGTLKVNWFASENGLYNLIKELILHNKNAIKFENNSKNALKINHHLPWELSAKWLASEVIDY